ncbi:Tyrosine kinase family catalytic domain protein [Ceratobasidium sp. AG-Ba]|nr:Tyrosine kinase family catalytic domain protein [Ceratobasidium sp. AG-Ba]QRV99615.1 Tyrosine kinase family catalytic domain protein [Ceratobasidium sp. AG-Ba]QRW14147.1 Tyrosine kinase family catalytic domain protein [Ceratobasidium sp. AG-Ba]
MGSIVRQLGADNGVWSIAVSSNGSLVAAGCGDKIMVWEVETGRIVHAALKGHTGAIWALAFSTDGRTIASGSTDKTIRIWDVERGIKTAGPLKKHKGLVYSVTFSPNGRLISSSSDETIRFWNATTGKLDGDPIETNQLTWSIAVSPDGVRVAAACQDWQVKTYDATSRKPLFYCVGHTNAVHSVAFSPDGTLIASASYDCDVRIWNGATGEPVGTFKGHTEILKSIAFSSDGRFVASGSDDKSVRIWDVAAGNMCGEPLLGHTERISGVAFIPGTNKLASAAFDNTVKIWDLYVPVHPTHPVSNSIPLEVDGFHAEINSVMAPNEIVRLLSLRGCTDLTNELDLDTCGDHPISSGGFGDIYRCKLISGTDVAIKTIRFIIDSVDQNRKHLKHAARELYTWSRCQHPNVQRLLGLAIFRNTLAMITVWEWNGNIPQYLMRNPTADRCNLSTQVADGLAYLHTCGVVHGDLKGVNILISRRGVPQLADFGNAILDDSTLQFTASSTKVAISSRWAAPELFTGGRWSTPADVYALGMPSRLLTQEKQEIITGEVPWSGKIEHAVIFAVMVEKACPDRPLKYIPEDSEQGEVLWALLRRCWEFEPEKRPAAEEVKMTVSLFKI